MFENNEINSIIDESTKYLDIFTATRYLIVAVVAAIALSLSLPDCYLLLCSLVVLCHCRLLTAMSSIRETRTKISELSALSGWPTVTGIVTKKQPLSHFRNNKRKLFTIQHTHTQLSLSLWARD
jgi:hypothetical protein